MPALTWAIKQLGRLHRERPDLVEDAVARLLESDRELRWCLVLSAYLDREINLGKASELLGIHELELRNRFVELGIPLRVGPSDLAEARAEVEAFEAWFGAGVAATGS